jgi:hypothetical protein
MKQTPVEWLVSALGALDEQMKVAPKTTNYKSTREYIIKQAKEMENEQHRKTYHKGLNSNFQYFEQYYNETFGTKEQMTREEKLETIVKLFAKSMFYGYWEWETPNERVITMLMQEVGMYPFKDEDEMISKTQVSDELYKQAIKEITSRRSKGWDESKTDKASEE